MSTRVVTACQDSGRSVSVVSNNSARAVHAYLARHGLDDRVGLVVARTSHDPALLKPSPHLITQAVEALDAEPGECTLVGDSVTDIQGARLAGAHSIGYANKPDKRERLAVAGAGVIINSLADLALKIRARGTYPLRARLIGQERYLAGGHSQPENSPLTCHTLVSSGSFTTSQAADGRSPRNNALGTASCERLS